MMEEEIVCVSLKALYKDTFAGMAGEELAHTSLMHVIRREPSPDGNDYYDLYRNTDSSLRLCCDGEQCKVLERTKDYVKLIDVENIDDESLDGIDTTFRLTLQEFDIATFGRN